MPRGEKSGRFWGWKATAAKSLSGCRWKTPKKMWRLVVVEEEMGVLVKEEMGFLEGDGFLGRRWVS